MNVSLLCLSVSDLLSLIFLQWFNVCVNPLLVNSDVPFYPPEFQYVTGGWPHVCFTRITLLITVFVAIERCLSITVPLKVKSILTPKRSLTVIAIIYVVMLLTLCPAYATIHIDWVFIPEKNRTLLGLVESDDRDEIESITIALNVGMQLLFFCAIVGSNFILIYELQKKTKWRQSAMSIVATSGGADDRSAEARYGETENIASHLADANAVVASRFLSVPNNSSDRTRRVNVGGRQEVRSATAHAAHRDRKLARMIVLLCAILFVCYLPSTVCLMVQLIESEFSIKGDYENMFFVGWSFAWIADAINSSVNIFVYYNMSTKYRATFKTLFARWHRKWRRVAPETTHGEQINGTGPHFSGAVNTRLRSPNRLSMLDHDKINDSSVCVFQVTPRLSS